MVTGPYGTMRDASKDIRGILVLWITRPLAKQDCLLSGRVLDQARSVSNIRSMSPQNGCPGPFWGGSLETLGGLNFLRLAGSTEVVCQNLPGDL